MEYVYSAMLLHAAGKPVSEENLKKVLTAAGVKADDTRVKALTAGLEGVNIDEPMKGAAATPAAGPAGPASCAGAGPLPGPLVFGYTYAEVLSPTATMGGRAEVP